MIGTAECLNRFVKQGFNQRGREGEEGAAGCLLYLFG